MMKSARAMALAVALLVPAATATAAPDPYDEAKRVYEEIKEELPGLYKDTFEFNLPDAPVPPEVSAWVDKGFPRKISITYPGDHGATVEEYYYALAGGELELVLAYQSITTEAVDGSNSTTRDHLFYFDDGRMLRWVDENDERVSPTSADFTSKEEELLATSDRVLAQMAGTLDDGGSGSGSGGGAEPVEEATGIFDGFEQGDYLYLHLSSNGEQSSFMILRTDGALEKLINNPEKYIGKRITVLWQNAVENIPEAGGPTEVTKAVSVKLPN